MRQNNAGTRRGLRAAAGVAAILGLLVIWVVGAGAARRHSSARSAAGYRLIHITPCQTDRAITCDTNPRTGAPVAHDIYVPARSPARPRLAVFFPGTGARPSYYAPVAQTLSAHGWYVIVLRYANSTGAIVACTNATARANPVCFRQFRSESIFGENVPDPTGHAYNSAGIQIDKANAVMNRLLKLVSYLVAHPATAGSGWRLFQAQRHGRCVSFNTRYGTCNLNWAAIALGGHSQGAGVALYLAKFYPVVRVALFSGPQDAVRLQGRFVADSWIAEGRFATPPARIYGFTHRDDPFYPRQMATWAALRLPGSLTPYAPERVPRGSHRIVTSVAPACPELGTALAAHSATAVVGCVALPGYANVWLAMFGPSSHS